MKAEAKQNKLRRFFKCHLEAAYMTKNFGIKVYLDVPRKNGKSFSSIEYSIDIPNLGQKEYKLLTEGKTDGSFGVDTVWKETGEQAYLSYTDSHDGEKYYVAPESESIFEPKEGDYGFDVAIPRTYYLSDGKWWSNAIHTKHHDRIKIIMRDNKQFFSGELENAN